MIVNLFAKDSERSTTRSEDAAHARRLCAQHTGEVEVHPAVSTTRPTRITSWPSVEQLQTIENAGALALLRTIVCELAQTNVLRRTVRATHPQYESQSIKYCKTLVRTCCRCQMARQQLRTSARRLATWFAATLPTTTSSRQWRRVCRWCISKGSKAFNQLPVATRAIG